MSAGKSAGGVEVVTTIPDLSNLGGMLFDSERRVFTRYRTKILRFVKGVWTGWKYQGRPVKAPRNVSLKAWKADVLVAGGANELHIHNEARGYQSGEPYVAYVARTKHAEPEWLIVHRALIDRFVPPMAKDITAEVARNLNTPRRPIRTREARPNTALIASGLEL